MFLGGGGPGCPAGRSPRQTQATIDGEVARLLREAEDPGPWHLISAHRDELGQLVDLLLEKETVDGEAVYQIAGMPVPEHRPEEMAIAPRAVASSGGAVASAGGAVAKASGAANADGAGGAGGSAATVAPGTAS